MAQTSTPGYPSSSGSGSISSININSNSNNNNVNDNHGQEHLMVAVRIRPVIDNHDTKCIQVASKKSLMFDEGNRNKPKRYIYDNVFAEDATQDMVYQTTTAPLVRDVLAGYTAAVFAYGATGSGKTHTMLGPNPKKARTPQGALNTGGDVNSAKPNSDGLMVKAISEIFNFVEAAENPNAFKVSISYLEIYNELIRDLLSPGAPLELREDKQGNQFVTGLSEVTTINQTEVIQLLLKGNKARTVEPTAANQTSSRSHGLLSVTVVQSSPMGTKQGKLFLTDLAGSERAKKTKNRGKRLQEGAHINRSLLALGNCINALAGGARYVNYRDSKLTRLLKEALSGRCKTVMIAHISPENKHSDETKNTLIYADRANTITTRLQNPELLEERHEYPTTHYQSLVTELRDEVNRLKSKMLSEPRPRSGAALQRNSVDDDRRKLELKNLRDQIVQTFKQQMRLRRRMLESDSHLLGLELDAERQHMVISHWQSRQGKLYNKRMDEADDDDEDADSESEGNHALRNAWNELAAIEKETKRYRDIRTTTERDLEACRQKGVALEDELPDRISSDEERELLALLCRVHELEADKVSLQAERMARQAELRRRDLQLLKAERQRRLCEDIISSQRRLIEEGKVELPEELKDLYALYQQEIHASTFNAPTMPTYSSTSDIYTVRLPPIPNSRGLINTPGSSSSSSDWSPSPLPPIEPVEEVAEASSFDRLMGAPVAPKLPSMRRLTSRQLRTGQQSTSSDE